MRNSTQADPDVLAVKNLLSGTLDDQEVAAVERKVAERQRTASATAISEPQEVSYKSRLAVIANWLSSKIRSYEPNRKVILWTSLGLLLVLRPGLVIGWSLFAMFLLLVSYLLSGHDRFWRHVVRLYRSFARRQPQAARRLKVRAYLFARKWDRMLEWLPQGLADTLKSPDLRELMSADARHDSAVADRLTRMGDNAAIR